MITSLLNIHSKHYQGTLFLKLFLENLQLKKDLGFNLNINTAKVVREYSVQEGRIDIYITDGVRHIILENKVNASDQDQQIKRYIEGVYKESQPQDADNKISSDDILVIYLWLDRTEPDSHSLGELKIDGNSIVDPKTQERKAWYKPIGYKTDILQWLQSCQKEVQNITNLNMAIEQYIHVVKVLTSQYKGKVMVLSDWLKENPEHYVIAKKVADDLSLAKDQIVKDFLMEEVFEKLQDKLGDNWEIDKYSQDKTYDGIYFYKINWESANKGNTFCFALETKECDLYFGLWLDKKRQDIKKKFVSKVEQLDNGLCIAGDKSDDQYWLYYKYFSEGKDLAEQILFKKLTTDDVVNYIAKHIKVFEALADEINQFCK